MDAIRCLVLFIFAISFTYAATGDILWSGCGAKCDFTSTKGCREVTTEGCYNGECVRVDNTVYRSQYCTNYESQHDDYCCDASYAQTVSKNLGSEITLVYWQKYTAWPPATHGGCKTVRLYSSAGDDDNYWNFNNNFPGPYKEFDGGLDGYSDPYNAPGASSGTFMLGEGVHGDPNRGCQISGSSTVCSYPEDSVKLYTNSDYINWGNGKWKEIRLYLKLPSTDSMDGQGDGQQTLWVDGRMVFSIENVKESVMGGADWNRIKWFPIEEASQPFQMYWDEMVAYEGYMPPDDCQPNCDGRVCGPDPVCGYSCGPCDGVCVDGQCNSVCTPDWQCTDWSDGDCGTRTCTDANSCGTNAGKPEETRTCPEPTPGLSVDSTYSGYSSAVIDDDVIDAYGGTSTTWASAQNLSAPHWVEIYFEQPIELNFVTIYWAYNANLGRMMNSQEVLVQYWDGDWVTVSTMNPPEGASYTARFDKVTTSMIRLLQPAGMGPVDYRSIMWLTEVDYGISCMSLADLMALLSEWKTSQKTMQDVLFGIQEWKNGC